MAIVFIVYFKSKTSNIDDKSNLIFINFFGLINLSLIILHIGLRPISSFYFTDMGTYAQSFRAYASGSQVDKIGDIYFNYFMKWCSSVMSIDAFFFLCALLYVIPLYYATKTLFKQYWFYSFLMLVISLSFWSYGTNGIRNGIATSLFLLAITRKNKYFLILFIIIAGMCHKSLYIPIIAFLITNYYKNIKNILIFWVICIPLSLALGSFWENFFLKFGFGDEERLSGYLSGNQDTLDIAVKTGFRWDFLLYGFIAVFAGWYFIFKKKFNDPIYNRIYSTFLIVNAFWILVIRANFSNRFAYLSWFMMGIVIIYPFLKNQFFNKQYEIISKIIVAYFIFTFVMNVILQD